LYRPQQYAQPQESRNKITASHPAATASLSLDAVASCEPRGLSVLLVLLGGGNDNRRQLCYMPTVVSSVGAIAWRSRKF